MSVELPETFHLCYQCKKCSAGCTISEESDLPIDEIIGWLQMGDIDRVLRSEHLWICTGCQSCTTRCPNGVKPGELLDYLRVMALDRGIKPSPRVKTFHDAFIKMLKKRGRSSEVALMSAFYMKHMVRLEDLKNGYDLFMSGRLKPLGGPKVKDKASVRAVFALKENHTDEEMEDGK